MTNQCHTPDDDIRFNRILKTLSVCEHIQQQVSDSDSYEHIQLDSIEGN